MEFEVCSVQLTSNFTLKTSNFLINTCKILLQFYDRANRRAPSFSKVDVGGISDHCGYVHEGEEAPERCPQCKQVVEWKVLDESAKLNFVTEHVIGIAKGTGDEMIKDLNAQFMGESTEVGMYLAMARQADREGYPEIAEAFKRYAFEEADHASRFAELLGEVVWDTKTNLYKRMVAECGACEEKMRIARVAKERNLDAIHDTVHEMAKDEARHGKGFEGLYNRYFK